MNQSFFFVGLSYVVSFVFYKRLIDKKMVPPASTTESSPSQEMCDIVFCQSPSGEMKGYDAMITFSNLVITANMVADCYLILLLNRAFSKRATENSN